MLSNLVLSQLQGCEIVKKFSYKGAAVAVVTQLITCTSHHGAHHFVVFAEGTAVGMSITGWDCVTSSGVLDTIDDNN